ncbi:MAG: D-alanyl-D-alanine carboxypeptidase/D-alanyl-D-alanine-endopeptidase [Verrucomicrobia bacterium]|nr:D-alanyl-D-alanine carboxypeptidase/D-alanyl-D-alanine-endopeptidase [Verrucomicrobiota bacterium]
MESVMRFCLLLVLSTAALFGDAWDHASVSAYAVHMGTGEVLIDENSDKSLVPSSCMKVVTTAAALEILGPESKFQTDLEIDGAIESGVLKGNLIIRGGGDPCLGSDAMGSNWEKQIEGWAAAVCEKGIKKIEGRVIGDASRWEKALAAPSWEWEDLGNYYGAGACALTFHENSYALYFKPGKKEGEAAAVIRTEPAVLNVNFQNEIKTGPIGSGDRACIYGSEFSQVHHLRGTIPLGVNEFAIKGAIPDPAAFCANLLAQALQKRGVVVNNQLIGGSKRTILQTTYSPTLKEIVYRTNQKSVNLYAEHLLKKMGEVMLKEGSTTCGTKAVTEFWKGQKIDLNGFNMVDGSGLSRKNLITTKQLVSILLKMKKSEHFPLFFDSLPQKNEQVRAKSGSMSLIRGYAGYAGDIAFAILVNGCTDGKKMNEKIDLFLQDLDRYGQMIINNKE